MDPSPFNFPEEKSERFPPNLQDSPSDDVIDHSTPNLLNGTSQSCLYQHSPPSIQGINPIL